MAMRRYVAWGCATALMHFTAAPVTASPLGLQAQTPQAANASRAPEKRAEKPPKSRKTRKVQRSGGAASAPP